MGQYFKLHPSVFVYSRECPPAVTPFASFCEKEGFSYVLKEEDAGGLETHFPCRCLELKAPTSLEEVGITAKVATALAKENIPCNVIAAYHHDYFLVPLTQGEKALEIVEVAFLNA